MQATEGVRARYEAVIAGRQTPVRDYFEDIDPSTGAVLTLVAAGGPEQIDAAVAAARHAFETNWRRTAPSERAALLRRLAGAIAEHAEELAVLESLDVGKPLSQARTDVRVAVRYWEFYASAVETMYGETIPLGPSLLAYTLREPLGVTAHITPWNYPIQMGSRTLAASLAAGNCTVLKPAEEAPLTMIRVAELAAEVGFPAGTVNVVPGLGETAGAALAAHPGVDHISFTGSVPVGSLVAAAAARNIVPVGLELGGKSPNIVFADADLDLALPVVLNSIIQNAGQTCSAGSRLLVAERAHDQVVERLARRMGELRIGPGVQDTDLGPVITQRQQHRVLGLVGAAAGTAELVTGGGAAGESGFFVQPTLLTGVTPEQPIFHDEVFGPVLAVTTFTDPDEATALANATDYGLVAAVWTSNVDTATAMARELRAGQVFVNTFGAGGGVELPFGGVGKSGYGREKGREGLIAYTQTKTVTIRTGS